jgi:hypothetical protein
MTRRVAALVLGLLTVGCGSSGPSSEGDPFAGSQRDATVLIIVQNLNFSDARLYTLVRGARKQLGIVGGKQDAEFTLPWSIPEPLQIEINLLAGPQCYTRELMVDPGDIIELQISTVFSQSSACR